MSRVTLDEATQGKFDQLREPTEVCNAAGQMLGVFCPVGKSSAANGGPAKSPFSIEELERRRKERTGKPLAQIWEELRQKGINIPLS